MVANIIENKNGLAWLITSTSQGVVHELVNAALRRGDSVGATSRHPEKEATTFKDSGKACAK